MESCNSDNSILVFSDDEKQSQFLSDVSPNDKPWDRNKVFCGGVSAPLLASEKLSHQKQGKRINECSQNLEFGWVLVSTKTGEVKLRLKYAQFCRVRYCPICQWRRALMWVSRFFDAFPRIYAAHPEMRYIMLTLTVKNCAITDLRSTVNQMSKAWERLTKRKDYTALGFVRSLEVTPEKDLYLNSKGEKSDTPKKGFSLIRKARPKYSHPHFHILLAVPPSYFSRNYLSKDKWAALWQDAMRLDYKPVCDVRIVKEKVKKEKLVEDLPLSEMENTTPEPMKALMSAITETIKYTTKPADMVKEKAWLLEMVDQMRNVRAVALGGIFKRFLKETETEQDLITASETDVEKVVTNEGGIHFGFRRDVKRYQRFYPNPEKELKESIENQNAIRLPAIESATEAIAKDKFSREAAELQRRDLVRLTESPKVAVKSCENFALSDEMLALSNELRAVVTSGKKIKEHLELDKRKIYQVVKNPIQNELADDLNDVFSFGNAPDYGEYD